MISCKVIMTMERKKENEKERFISVLLPYLVRGIQSECLDYRAGSYMVLGQLFKEEMLQEKLLENIMAKLIEVSEDS